MFGSPSSTYTTAEGLEIWTYRSDGGQTVIDTVRNNIPYINQMSGVAQAMTKPKYRSLEVIFSRSGVVQTYNYREG